VSFERDVVSALELDFLQVKCMALLLTAVWKVEVSCSKYKPVRCNMVQNEAL